MVFREIVAPTVKELFVQQLEGMILSGELRPGDRLPTERELADEMKISKTVVHEGLRELHRLGFLDIASRRGVTVADYAQTGSLETLRAIMDFHGGIPDRKTALSILRLRYYLEAPAMEELAARHTAADMAALRALQRQAEEASARSIEDFAQALFRYHRGVTFLSGNTITPLIFNAFTTVNLAFWQKYIASEGTARCLETLERFTDCIAAGEGAAAELLRTRIREELGFTVNIGISSNKLLAKMAGEFEKPDKVHTLFPEEVPQKLWPLPVRELFMLGPATERRLNRIGIHTIGELAQADPELVLHYLNKPGLALWHSANGRCSEELLAQPEANKGYGNSTTLPADVTTEAGAQRVLLSLCETVAMRLRRDGKAARCISVSLRSADFVTFSHQTMLREAVHGTEELFRCACRVFAEAWDGQTPLRQLGVQATRLEEPQPRQLDLFAVGGAQQYARKAILDGTVDALREKYGEGVIRRARFTGADTVLAGGLSRERRTGITKPLDAE